MMRRRAASQAWWVPAVTAGTVAMAAGHARGQAAQINALTGNLRTRIVWLEGGDPQWGGGALKGFDTQTGSVTTIQAAAYRQTRPILCTGGNRVVYTIDGVVYIVNFDGTGKRHLVNGLASDVWEDPATGQEWVIVRVGSDGADGKYWRYRIENTADAVQLCDRGGGFPQVAWWQVSADGKWGAELLPYPFFAVLVNGGLDIVQGADRINPRLPNNDVAKGCWSSMACDNSYWSFHFDQVDAGHTRLYMCREQTPQTNVPITAPSATGGFYHPKFASGNAASGGRFLTLTNNDNGSAGDVEVYFGKFNATYTGFDGWARVTTNTNGDYYPDCWVGVGSSSPSIRLNPTSLSFAAAQGGSNPASQSVAVTTPSGTLSNVAASDNQTWLTTSVSGLGASWTIVNNVNVAGLTAGTHTATVTVTATGVPSNTYTVTLTIGAPVASRVEIKPDSARLAFGQNLQFSASVLDQQGTPLSPQPAVTWSLSGAGTARLSAAGLFAAGTTAMTYGVVAASGALRDTAKVVVYRAITTTYPTGGEALRVGQTITIRWSATDDIVGIDIEVSPDGETYYRVTSSTVTRTDGTWGAYPWTIPATVGGGVPLTTNQCRLRLYNYADASMSDITPLAFSVPVAAATGVTVRRGVQVRDMHGQLVAAVPWDDPTAVTVIGPDGRVLVRAGSGAGDGIITLGPVHGYAVVRIESRWTGQRVECPTTLVR